MSTSIENLRRVSEINVKDHIALFDLYVTAGRNIEYLAIRFGIDPEDIMHILEGYGEDTSNDSGRGRLKGLHRVLIEEYVEHFYPGIASENPQNSWITIEGYLDVKHPKWRKGM